MRSAVSEDAPATEAPTAHLTTYGAGDGPRAIEGQGGAWHLLDAKRSLRQSNAVALDASSDITPVSHARLTCQLRVLEGGDGGAFFFLNTNAYGHRGPAPFVKSWVEPNLKGTFAVGIDVHNPPDKEMFSAWGNYQNLPQREVSLHYDGRELIKRVAPTEFRGDFAEVNITLAFVTGGAEVTVEIAGAKVYDQHFLPHVTPYPMRLAMGAGTRGKATTEFDVKGVQFATKPHGSKRRPPLHVELFNHVLTNNTKVFYETTADLPPASWAFERVILTLDIHDAGNSWDEWDRNGEVSLFDDDGRKLGIVPFITSYRTECHWKVDVTHFRPWLTGKRKFEIRAGTTFYKNRGYMLSVSLDFHHGVPKQEPYRIVPLWHGTARYVSDENHFRDFFPARDVAIPAEATGARIWSTTTGHSQVGEFTPSNRTIGFQPDITKDGDHRYEDTLWKTDVYLNPNRPQFGTWKFSRAGWAPGDIVHPWWIDLTPHLQPGVTARVQYTPEPYAFPKGRPTDKELKKPSHVIRSYLVLYRDAKGLAPAPALRIANVVKKGNAATAGIRRGDYLAEYDGTRMDSIDDLRTALQRAADRKGKIKAIVFRGTQRMDIELDPGRLGIGLGR